MAVKYECDKCHNLFDAKLTPVSVGKDHYEICNGCLHEITQLLLNPKFRLKDTVLVRDIYNKDFEAYYEGEIFRLHRYPENGDKFYHYDVIMGDGTIISDIPETVIKFNNGGPL